MARSVYHDALDTSFSARASTQGKCLKVFSMLWTLTYAVLGTIIPFLHDQERAFFYNLKSKVKTAYLTLRWFVNAILAIAGAILALFEKYSSDETDSSDETTTNFTTTKATTTTKRYDPSGRKKRETSEDGDFYTIAYAIFITIGVAIVFAIIYMVVRCAIIYMATRCAIIYMAARCNRPSPPMDDSSDLATTIQRPMDLQGTQDDQDPQGTQDDQDPQGTQDPQDTQDTQDPQNPARPQDNIQNVHHSICEPIDAQLGGWINELHSIHQELENGMRMHEVFRRACEDRMAEMAVEHLNP